MTQNTLSDLYLVFPRQSGWSCQKFVTEEQIGGGVDHVTWNRCKDIYGKSSRWHTVAVFELVTWCPLLLFCFTFDLCETTI